MEFKNATIKRIGELKTFKNSDFTCVEWVITTDEQYPQTIQLQSNKEKADNLIKYNKVGDKVDVSFNIRGREWTNPEGEVKVFNTLEAWKVFKAENNLEKAKATIDEAFPPETFETVKQEDLTNNEVDELPF